VSANELVRSRIVPALESAFSSLRYPFQTSEQDNHAVRSIGFKKNSRRVYCFVLLEDRIQHRPENLVFRFRADSEIQSWFKERNVSAAIRSWQPRFRAIWDEQSGVSKRYSEPSIVTAQYGICLNEGDCASLDFVSTLTIFLEIAVEAVCQSSLRKDRDWHRYEILTS
jgi:hypothetical protein